MDALLFIGAALSAAVDSASNAARHDGMTPADVRSMPATPAPAVDASNPRRRGRKVAYVGGMNMARDKRRVSGRNV